MNVVSAAERLHQQRIFREMGQQPQLDLRIVGGEHHVARLGNESSANLAAQLRADGNILQVRVRGREPPRRRPSLVERGVQAFGRRVQKQRERIHVGALELRKLAILQHQPRNFVLGREIFQNVHRRRDHLALAVLHRLGQVQFVEENVAQLLGRIDVEFCPGLFVDLAGFDRTLAVQTHGKLTEDGGIDLDPGFLHPRQHRNERQIDLLIDVRQSRGLDFSAQYGRDASSDIGRPGQRVCQLQIEAADSNLRQRVIAVRGIDQVGVKHGLIAHAGQSDPAGRQLAQRSFAVMDGFGLLRIGQQPLQIAAKLVVTYRDSKSLARLGGKPNLQRTGFRLRLHRGTIKEQRAGFLRRFFRLSVVRGRSHNRSKFKRNRQGRF